MRLSRFGLVFAFLAACGAPQEPKSTVNPATPPEAAEQSAPAQAPDKDNPAADPLADVAWSPATSEQPEATDQMIDLETGEDYNKVLINGEPPREARKSIKCKTVKDCANMSIPKTPGDRRCIENTCVYVRKKMEIFEVL